MFRLTERRFVQVEDLLERCREQLKRDEKFDTTSLEFGLRSAFGVKNHQMKSLVRDIFDRYGRYRLVILYFMQHMSGPGPVYEYQRYIHNEYATLGLDRFEEADRQTFWRQQIESLRREDEESDDGFQGFYE